MKAKKLVCMMMTGVMAVGVFAGCGSTAENGDAQNTVETGTTEDTGAENTEAETGAESEAESEAENETESNSDFDASEMINVVSREEGSGTRGAFIELFRIEEKDADGNKVDNTTEEAVITNNTEVMMTTISGDDYAIGYVSLGSLQDSVKPIQIDGADATVENIKDSSYKIARPFNIITTDNVNETAQDFINYILSKEGQQVITDNGYIGDDEAQPYEKSDVTGKIVVAGSSSVTPVMEKLKEAYTKENGDVEVEVQESDSTTGVQSAISGTCDIGMASRDLADSESEDGAKATKIAMDGIAVIVNKNNPVDGLTSEQVKNIFTGACETWDEAEK